MKLKTAMLSAFTVRWNHDTPLPHSIAQRRVPSRSEAQLFQDTSNRMPLISQLSNIRFIRCPWRYPRGTVEPVKNLLEFFYFSWSSNRYQAGKPFDTSFLANMKVVKMLSGRPASYIKGCILYAQIRKILAAGIHKAQIGVTYRQVILSMLFTFGMSTKTDGAFSIPKTGKPPSFYRIGYVHREILA